MLKIQAQQRSSCGQRSPLSWMLEDWSCLKQKGQSRRNALQKHATIPLLLGVSLGPPLARSGMQWEGRDWYPRRWQINTVAKTQVNLEKSSCATFFCLELTQRRNALPPWEEEEEEEQEGEAWIGRGRGKRRCEEKEKKRKREKKRRRRRIRRRTTWNWVGICCIKYGIEKREMAEGYNQILLNQWMKFSRMKKHYKKVNLRNLSETFPYEFLYIFFLLKKTWFARVGRYLGGLQHLWGEGDGVCVEGPFEWRSMMQMNSLIKKYT